MHQLSTVAFKHSKAALFLDHNGFLYLETWMPLLLKMHGLSFLSVSLLAYSCCAVKAACHQRWMRSQYSKGWMCTQYRHAVHTLVLTSLHTCTECRQNKTSRYVLWLCFRLHYVGWYVVIIIITTDITFKCLQRVLSATHSWHRPQVETFALVLMNAAGVLCRYNWPHEERVSDGGDREVNAANKDRKTALSEQWKDLQSGTVIILDLPNLFPIHLSTEGAQCRAPCMCSANMCAGRCRFKLMGSWKVEAGMTSVWRAWFCK